MKRLFVFALALWTALALAAPAFADVMWEPMDNAFYDRHSSQCEYENRSWYANGEKGFVTMWDAPNGSMVRSQFENGKKLWVYYIYQDSWALTAYWANGSETSGWVPLPDLARVYDYSSFQEEYADRIMPYNGEFADYDGDIERVNFYAYPGAPEVYASFELENINVLENLTGTEEHPSYISGIFVDEDGLTWGMVGYLYGARQVWFCLDQPDGEDFPVRAVPDPGLTPARTPTLPAAGYTPYLLVAAVVAVTAGLLVFFYGKKRKKSTD